MPIPTVDEIRRVGDFTALVHWNLVFNTFPALGAYPPSSELNLRCVSASLPVVKGSSIPVQIRGQVVNQPGLSTRNGTLKLDFNETENGMISLVLREWSEAISQVRTGIQGTKRQVECVITLFRLDRSGRAVYQYTMFGCFLESYALTNLDGSSNELFKPNMTIAYDYFTEGPV